MNGPDGDSMSRKELQAALKARGLPAVGSTEALRVAYNQACGILSVDLAHSAVASPDRKRPAAKKEKRLRKTRTTVSQKTRARIDRAKTQRLYLVERGEIKNGIECDFVVLGSTGNVYNVHVGHLLSCTCPDHEKGNLCKHVLFVFLKVMGLDSDSHVIYQAALLTSELKEIFATMAQRQTGGVMANSQVRATYAAGLAKKDEDKDDTTGVQRKSLDAAADCPICFDEMRQGGLTFCRAMCGTNFHEDCIRRWLQQQQQSQPTCPNCRQPWQQSSESKDANREGYTNLGRLQGLSPVRDTSTYQPMWSGSSYKKRRRWY